LWKKSTKIRRYSRNMWKENTKMYINRQF
jgi:hypothetical protein